jgi:hypothetical protein
VRGLLTQLTLSQLRGGEPRRGCCYCSVPVFLSLFSIEIAIKIMGSYLLCFVCSLSHPFSGFFFCLSFLPRYETVTIRTKTCASVTIRTKTCASVTIRTKTFASVTIRTKTFASVIYTSLRHFQSIHRTGFLTCSIHIGTCSINIQDIGFFYKAKN